SHEIGTLSYKRKKKEEIRTLTTAWQKYPAARLRRHPSRRRGNILAPLSSAPCLGGRPCLAASKATPGERRRLLPFSVAPAETERERRRATSNTNTRHRSKLIWLPISESNNLIFLSVV
uniref:Uncharacterized protein n=1 Tax=Aegilops tauschii subsp. strangulata TaxID=200361 RepID=A0A453GUJ5_AEGTS